MLTDINEEEEQDGHSDSSNERRNQNSKAVEEPIVNEIEQLRRE